MAERITERGGGGVSATPKQRLSEALDGLMSAIEHLCRLPSWSVSPEVYKRAMMALQEATLARGDLADALKLAQQTSDAQTLPPPLPPPDPDLRERTWHL